MIYVKMKVWLENEYFEVPIQYCIWMVPDSSTSTGHQIITRYMRYLIINVVLGTLYFTISSYSVVNCFNDYVFQCGKFVSCN
jgi:hypothetical protein